MIVGLYIVEKVMHWPDAGFIISKKKYWYCLSECIWSAYFVLLYTVVGLVNILDYSIVMYKSVSEILCPFKA